jgi:hypothetical protein
MAHAAAQLAEDKAAEADQQHALAQRNLVDQAANFAVGDKSEAEVFRVSTDAISPEIPLDAYLLIDKKATSFAVGDIVVYTAEGNNYLGRVVAVEKATGRLTVGRNGESPRQVAVRDVLGRGVLNTR